MIRGDASWHCAQASRASAGASTDVSTSASDESSASASAGGYHDGASVIVPVSGIPSLSTAQLYSEPMRLFTVLRKPVGPESTEAALALATLTFQERGSGARTARVRLADLPTTAAVSINLKQSVTGATAQATVTDVRGNGSVAAAALSVSMSVDHHDAVSRHGTAHPGALTLRAVQGALRELEVSEDCNTLVCPSPYATRSDLNIYAVSLAQRLPVSNGALFCRKQATALSMRWGIFASHTAFMGAEEAREQPDCTDQPECLTGAALFLHSTCCIFSCVFCCVRLLLPMAVAATVPQ